jgi:uncharacterized protein
LTLVAIISDTHLPRGRRALAPECLDVLAAADLILHAGDITAATVLDELRLFGRLEAVRGNMDDSVLRATLPERLVLDVAGVRVGMLHDPGPRIGRAQRLTSGFAACAIVIYGHTHVPELSRQDKIWILNPGSPTERRSAPSRSLMTLKIDHEQVRPELLLLP